MRWKGKILERSRTSTVPRRGEPIGKLKSCLRQQGLSTFIQRLQVDHLLQQSNVAFVNDLTQSG